MPAGHLFVHGEVFPTEVEPWYVPALHDIHVEIDVAPTVDEYVPALQDVHEELPANEYVPAPHVIHDVRVGKVESDEV